MRARGTWRPDGASGRARSRRPRAALTSGRPAAVYETCAPAECIFFGHALHFRPARAYPTRGLDIETRGVSNKGALLTNPLSKVLPTAPSATEQTGKLVPPPRGNHPAGTETLKLGVSTTFCAERARARPERSRGAAHNVVRQASCHRVRPVYRGGDRLQEGGGRANWEARTPTTPAASSRRPTPPWRPAFPGVASAHHAHLERSRSRHDIDPRTHRCRGGFRSPTHRRLATRLGTPGSKG